MLNPSTADDVLDDPTVRKCRGFSQRWGFRAMIVTNLFSFRATDPKELRTVAKRDYAKAVGINDDGCIIKAAQSADLVIAAWGFHGDLYGRDKDVICRVLPDTTLHCIGLTMHGMPVHPLMARYTNHPVVYRDRTSD